MAIGKCSQCGWQGPIHRHHPDRKGNPKSMIDLCPNCHALEHHVSDGFVFRWGIPWLDDMPPPSIEEKVWAMHIWLGDTVEGVEAGAPSPDNTQRRGGERTI